MRGEKPPFFPVNMCPGSTMNGSIAPIRKLFAFMSAISVRSLALSAFSFVPSAFFRSLIFASLSAIRFSQIGTHGFGTGVRFFQR